MIFTPVSHFRIVQEVARAHMARIFPCALGGMGIRPLYANFWVTTSCSGRCQTCTQWRQQAGDEMDTKSAEQMILRLKDAGIRIIYFVGGDVFLREDIFELIRFAAHLGLRTHLTINGFTVTEEVVKALASSNLASLHLSLDTLTGDFDRIRGVKEASAKVLSALDLIRHHCGRQIRLGITTTIMKRTIPAVPDVVRFAISQNLVIHFNLINFTHDFFSTDFSRAQYELDPGDQKALAALVAWLKQKRIGHPHLLPRLDHLEWIARYFADRYQKRTPCYQTMLKICIRPNGEVRPCCSMGVTGNVRTQALEDLLSSEPYLTSIRKALSKDCPGCSCRFPLNLDIDPRSWVREIGLRVRMALSHRRGIE